MKIQLKTDNIGGCDVRHLDFLEGRIVLKTFVYGKIINSVIDASKKQYQVEWKHKIANQVFSTRNDLQNENDHYAISLSMMFYADKRKRDVENYIKPIIDAIAVGLFTKNKEELDSITEFNKDDSNFNHIYVERLTDTVDPLKQGVAITVSMI